MARNSFLVFLALLTAGCASQRLAGADLDRVKRPAFISRIEIEAGPRSLVFQEDDAYKQKLKKLEPKEADRRLQAKLAAAVTRFEVSERLRVNTFRQLPLEERPWMNTVDPARVATVLESFLVEEVPANAPDYDLLSRLGVDTVVEFVIQEYGMRSEKGRAGPYIQGYARMFKLEGRAEFWRRPFRVDRVAEGAEPLDPFKVGKEPTLFRQQITEMLDVLAGQFAEELSPKDRKGGAPLVEGDGPDSVHTTGREPPPPTKPPEPELAPGELPDPDP
ncbi:hypothetical protein JRI60_27535 [Archangium violaceum]|uniref:hypothetical protein n=1 Tax=Archangium violaceum TaxID=83451 RepID=UPI00194E18BA|nr:hypothetical protein [Archangium violaceum]QRN92962.1 hypothetical protein JRI60_27535 [Archangium violaceum]